MKHLNSVLIVKTILENEEGENEGEVSKDDDEENNGKESMVWRDVCCTALERHGENAEVQVSDVIFYYCQHVILFVLVFIVHNSCIVLVLLFVSSGGCLLGIKQLAALWQCTQYI